MRQLKTTDLVGKKIVQIYLSPWLCEEPTLESHRYYCAQMGVVELEDGLAFVLAHDDYYTESVPDVLAEHTEVFEEHYLPVGAHNRSLPGLRPFPDQKNKFEIEQVQALQGIIGQRIQDVLFSRRWMNLGLLLENGDALTIDFLNFSDIGLLIIPADSAAWHRAEAVHHELGEEGEF